MSSGQVESEKGDEINDQPTSLLIDTTESSTEDSGTKTDTTQHIDSDNAAEKSNGHASEERDANTPEPSVVVPARTRRKHQNEGSSSD